MNVGVFKYWDTDIEENYEGEVPCEYGNEELLASLQEYYSNIATAGVAYWELTPHLGEGFTLTEQITKPLPPPEFITKNPLSPDLLPTPNYPSLQVEPLLYRVTELQLKSANFTLPTPATNTLVVFLIFVIIITELKEKYVDAAAFVPIFFEPHLLIQLLFSGGKRRV